MEGLIKKAANKLDNQLDFKKIVKGVPGAVLEFIDGKMFKIALNAAVDRLPEQYHNDLQIVLKAYVKEDYSHVEAETIARLNEAVNLPGLNEAEEEIILNAVIGSFFKIVEGRGKG